MRILVLYRKVLENYRYLYDHLQLVSKFQNNDWDIFHFEYFQYKNTKYLYSNY